MCSTPCSLLFLHSTLIIACAVARVRLSCTMDCNACGWHCISCVAGAFATGDCVLRRAPTVISSSSMLCGGICGSFPSLYMRHPMLNRLSPVVHLPICTPHNPHILALTSAGARAQASLGSGQAIQITARPLDRAVMTVAKSYSAMKAPPKAFQKAIPTACPQAVLLPACQCAATSHLAVSEKATCCNHRCPPQHNLTSTLLTR